MCFLSSYMWFSDNGFLHSDYRFKGLPNLSDLKQQNILEDFIFNSYLLPKSCINVFENESNIQVLNQSHLECELESGNKLPIYTRNDVLYTNVLVNKAN